MRGGMNFLSIIGVRRGPARAALAGLLVGGLALAGCSTEPTKAPESGNDFTGAGATFPAPIYAKWGSAYRKVSGNKLNYQAIGSGAGIAQIKARTVDFGATDAPMAPEELAANGLVQFPAVIGALVTIVNIPGIDNGALKLTPAVIADIYQGKITRWNDPALVKLNPGLTLRPVPITPVYRSDSSGTTAVFTNFMKKAAPNWTLGAGKTVSWPVGTGGKGNDGVAGNVKNSVGTIGYVEFNYAAANRLAMTQLANADGKFVLPAPAGFVAAASQADWANAPGATVDMLNLPGADVWPIVSATYILMPMQPARKQPAAEVIRYFAWCFRDGGAAAEELGYVPLPLAATSRAAIEWRRVKVGDAA